MLAGPGEEVGDERMAGDGIDVGAARDVLLEDVVLDGAGELADDVRARSPRRPRRRRAGWLAVALMVIEVETLSRGMPAKSRMSARSRWPRRRADFAEGEGMVGVVADLGGEVEGDGEAGLCPGEEEFVAALDSSASPMPAYWRMVQRRPRYMVGWMPRV
jgi:hypothetical protein